MIHGGIMKKFLFLFTLSLLLVSMAWGQGVEDFTNSNATTAYAASSFVGNNGITWNYVASRDANEDANGSGIALPALMLRRIADSSAISSSPISGGIGDFSVKLYKGFTGAGDRQVELFVNGVSKGLSTPFDDYNMHLFEITGINITGNISIEIKNSTSRQVIVDDISWTAYASAGPSLLVAPAALTAFSYVEGSGPSVEQSFTLSAFNLDGNVSLVAPTDYAISLSSDSGYMNSLSIAHVAGSVAETTIYVRLIAGLNAGLYNDEIIQISAGTANPKTVTLSGSVSATLPTEGYIVNFDGDGEIKTGYATGTVNLSGLDWDLTQALIGDSTSDFLNGIRAVRLNGKANSSMTMLADKSGGLGSLSFPYRRYGTDAQVAWKAEYSSDAGATWNQIGTAFTATADVQTFSEVVNVAGNIRIKISLVDDIGTSNKRINIDDIALSDFAGGGGTPILNISGEIQPLFNIAGLPSEEFGQYSLSGQELSGNINIIAPEHFELATTTMGAWSSSLSLSPSFSGLIYVRINSFAIGEHSGNIVHSSFGATDISIRVEGETLEPLGAINVNSSMNAFVQELGSPSAMQSYSFSSTGLSSMINISTSAPFELSQNGSTNWAASIDVAHSYSGQVYVRLNASEIGEYDNIEILHVNANATPVSIYVSGSASAATGPVDNLFFSEYIEGASNNKAIEIFNASNSSVDLSRYQVELYPNGAATPNNTLLLTGSLAPGAVYVIANSGAAAEILAVANITATVTFFNGDDALALRCINPDTIIDVFGTIGSDPGTGWAVAGVNNATVDHTLIRKPTVGQGNTNWAIQAGTDAASSEWLVMPVGYHADLGTHTYNPGGNVASAPTFDPPAGIYLNTLNVSISSATAGATIRYTTDGSDPSSTVGTIYSNPIYVATSTTIKAIAYAAGMDPSYIGTAVYALPANVSTIAQLRTQPTGTSHVYTLTGEAILTYKNAARSLKYIQDATAAIVIDDYSGIITTDYALYDGITGITGTLNVYNGLLQFIPVSNPAAATSTNNVVNPQIRTLSSLTEADQGKLIKVQGLSISHPTFVDFPATAQNLTATDASAALTLRTFANTDYANTPIPTEAVNLICLVGQFGTDMQVSPRFLSDIQAAGDELNSPVLTIVQTANNIELNWNAIAGANSYRIEASNDPYTNFSLAGTTGNTTFSMPANSAMKFFRVIAQP